MEALAYLGGHREVAHTSEGHSQPGGGGGRGTRSTNRSWVREPVVTGHLIYGLPRWHAYVLGLGTRPVVIRFPPGYRRARKALRRLDRAGPAEPSSAAPIARPTELRAVPDPAKKAA